MKFYRYKTIYYETGPRIILENLKGIKETPCGWWIIKEGSSLNTITTFGDRKRWVSMSARKRYAYPTKKEALVNFKARKERQIQILRSRLHNAVQELSQAEKIEKTLPET